MGKLRVYLADDHKLFAEALAMTLEKFPSIFSVDFVFGGKPLIALCDKSVPDVVVTDYDMPDMGGDKVLTHLVKHHPEVKIIVLTMYDNLEVIRRCIELGAHAFLTKNTDAEELEQAIISVVKNDYYHNELSFKALRGFIRNKNSNNRKIDLSGREKEVLQLICDELTMKEIGEKLFLSDKTIQNHRASLLKKMGARNTAGLVKKAIEGGLYDVS